MGFLKERHGMTMFKNTPPGTCPMCAVKHDPEQPHNRDSLAYQYKFYDEFGRWPTWADAMAHCPEDIKRYWTEELGKRGIDIDERPETKSINIQISGGAEK